MNQNLSNLEEALRGTEVEINDYLECVTVREFRSDIKKLIERSCMEWIEGSDPRNWSDS